MAFLIINENGEVRTRAPITGEEIIVRTPCDGTSVEGVIIAGVEYPFYDAAGNAIGARAGLFSANTLIKVLIDVNNTRAILETLPGTTFLSSTAIEANLAKLNSVFGTDHSLTCDWIPNDELASTLSTSNASASIGGNILSGAFYMRFLTSFSSTSSFIRLGTIKIYPGGKLSQVSDFYFDCQEDTAQMKFYSYIQDHTDEFIASSIYFASISQDIPAGTERFVRFFAPATINVNAF